MPLTKVTMGLLKDLAAKVMEIMQNHSNITSETKTAVGTAVDFMIPAGVKRVTVLFDNVSTNGSSLIQLQLGVGGGVITSGYEGSAISDSGGTVVSSTTGALQTAVLSSTMIFRGDCVISLMVANKWLFRGRLSRDLNGAMESVGRVTLVSSPDRVRITTVNGTDQFDAGAITVTWEY